MRVDGTIYTSYGHTERSAIRYSSADEADCEDVGQDAAGTAITEHPRQVTTWAFSGFPPKKVLGVRVDQDSFTVFVAQSLPTRSATGSTRTLPRRRVRRFQYDRADSGSALTRTPLVRRSPRAACSPSRRVTA